MKPSAVILALVLAATGCTTKSKSQLQAQRAYLAGQNAALRQPQAMPIPSVTIIGAVQNPTVPWVVGLNLTQAIATANYLDSKEPEIIILTRQGQSATLPPNILFTGAVVPLEPGDVVEIR